jgi:hypothetical protein
MRKLVTGEFMTSALPIPVALSSPRELINPSGNLDYITKF